MAKLAAPDSMFVGWRAKNVEQDPGHEQVCKRIVKVLFVPLRPGNIFMRVVNKYTRDEENKYAREEENKYTREEENKCTREEGTSTLGKRGKTI